MQDRCCWQDFGSPSWAGSWGRQGNPGQWGQSNLGNWSPHPTLGVCICSDSFMLDPKTHHAIGVFSLMSQGYAGSSPLGNLGWLQVTTVAISFWFVFTSSALHNLLLLFQQMPKILYSSLELWGSRSTPLTGYFWCPPKWNQNLFLTLCSHGGSGMTRKLQPSFALVMFFSIWSSQNNFSELLKMLAPNKSVGEN